MTYLFEVWEKWNDEKETEQYVFIYDSKEKLINGLDYSNREYGQADEDVLAITHKTMNDWKNWDNVMVKSGEYKSDQKKHLKAIHKEFTEKGVSTTLLQL